MGKDIDRDRGKIPIAPIKWCRHIVDAGYITAAIIIMAHVVWYYAARSVLAWPPDIYLRNYIILPAIGLFALTILIDLAVRSLRVPLPVKEFLSLSLFIIFSAYLVFTHDIAKVILGAFILPIFASAIFSNLKITRWMFWLSILAVLMLGVKMYSTGKLDSSMSMQIFVACFMFLCSYLLAKVLIRYGNDNIATLLDYDNQQRYMQEQLMLDPFTGLYNRKTFDEYLSRLMEACRSTGKQLALAMIDVDHFKRVNDFYGHAVGDQVLLYLSNILKENKAENIHVFRIGGEEFAVLFKDCDEKEAYRICDDMRKRMESASLRSIDKKRVTFSCGLVYMNSEILSPEAFTAAADAALYAAKNRGRNNIAIYGASFERV